MLGRWVISVQFLWLLWSLFFYSVNSREPLGECCFTEGGTEKARRSWGNIAIRNGKSVLHLTFLVSFHPYACGTEGFNLCNFVLS